MTPHVRQIWKLRVSAIVAGVILITALFCPIILLVYDAHAAQDAATAVGPATAPVTVLRADPTPLPTQSWWQASLTPVLSAFAMAFAAFLVAGLRKLTQLIENKWKVDIPDSVERMMGSKARWAVAWVEEKAEKRLLHGDGKATPGAEKINEVVDLLQEFADSLGYGHQWQKDKIEALAEGVLHLERDKTIGSAGERAKLLAAKTNGNP